MKAMLLESICQDLNMTETKIPVCGEENLLVRICATGLNFADTLLIDGQYQDKPQLPFAPGMEICGIVVEIGSKVNGFKEGEKIISYIGYGGLAQYASVLANDCIKIPSNFSSIEVSSLMITYGTSQIALNRKANLLSTETLLVMGASGGVGLTAVELGKISGAKVIGVARGKDKCKILKSYGVDLIIDSNNSNLVSEIKEFGGADVIYDPVGGEKFSLLMKVANFNARILPIGFASGQIPQIPANIIMVKNLTVIGVHLGAYKKFQPHVISESLMSLVDMFAKKLIRPHVSNIFPLEKANEALKLIRERKSIGKVVISISED